MAATTKFNATNNNSLCGSDLRQDRPAVLNGRNDLFKKSQIFAVRFNRPRPLKDVEGGLSGDDSVDPGRLPIPARRLIEFSSDE
jgi:hypothetical protein